MGRRRDWRRWRGRASRRPATGASAASTRCRNAGAWARWRYMLARISGCGRSPNRLSRSTSCPGLGRDVGFRRERRQGDVGRRQARALLRRAVRRRLAAQPGHQGAQREEVDGVGMVVARQHGVDAGRLRRRRATPSFGTTMVSRKRTSRLVGHALQVERLHGGPGPRQGAVDRREVAPHQIDHAHAHRGADVGEEVGGLAGRRRFGDGRKRIAHSAACLESCPSTVKNEAVLGCLGSSTSPSVSRANRASLPRTMRPSFGLGIGLRAIGTASAAV